ncbi:LacI family DNA-binding transcriptional regulator [Streptomyces sp. MB09-02B]|uniref:LacI family DNA-binding transcriptional regulator n=1 Tax=Streptomyces sp. MB09-02B TaxID=3028667 RepID=UPI0029BBFCEF|nr:LacI family DNA-binding transcriptional regulator [Streptomyces sp. MB09-02B]MDX3639119.1 LacI family DNA-binding transcriptional regulator [Streptomyces sp. MB09-02B]
MDNGSTSTPGPTAVSRRRRSQSDAERPSTIRDVAERAGVSVATVSRTLAGNYPVSAATRERVMEAVESLHYVVNIHAKALSGRVAGPIALVLRDITGPSLAHVAAGIEQEAALQGRLSLVCATHGDAGRENDLVQLMREQHAAAVVLVGGAVQDEAYFQRMTEYARTLHATGSRLVLVGRPPLPGDLPVTVVDYDNRGGAFQAADHLLAQGHRRVLYLGGDPRLSTGEQRRQGYLHALRAHGVKETRELNVPGLYTRVSGYQRTRDALKAGVDFTGIIAGTDMVALGALAALREAGLSIPQDISLVGFDDVLFAADLSPSLTSVRVPYEDLGRTAVRLALDRTERISGGDHVVLSTQLVIRQSVSRPRP